ncbi:MAG: hypothetical protein ACRD1V_12160 [Vicinamibacterales bacterium]
MSSAIEEFRALRVVVQDVQGQLVDVAKLLGTLRDDVSTLAQNPDLRTLLQEEQTWLARATDLVTQVRALRELERSQHRRAVWRRWVAAVVFSLVSAAACGAGYVWAAKPYESELASLRERVELLDFVAQRVITMTPAERRQFDALLKPGDFRPR